MLFRSIIKPQILKINKFGNISKNRGVLLLGDHIVLWSKVDSSTIGSPMGASTIAFTVPKSSLSFRTTSKVKFPSIPGIPSSIGTRIVPFSSVITNSSPRSEERRVGKEWSEPCSDRVWHCRSKQKTM